jgi:hypothetical protein
VFGVFGRPVMAILDVEVLQVNDQKSSVLREVIARQGPPDGTVIVTLSSGQPFSDELIDTIVNNMQEIGALLLVRYG